MKLLSHIIIFLLVTSLLPVVRAGILPDNCSHFLDWRQEECQNILSDGSLGLEQKQDLYLNLVNEQGELASFDFIRGWNNGIEWNSPPLTASIESDGIIRNAWVKIVSINKSYFDLNKEEWFAEPFGEVLAEHGYSIELPDGTEAGDCQTNYSYEVLNENFEVKLNGDNIGNQRLTEYSIEPINGFALSFSALFSLQTKLRVEHFKEHEFCEPNGECTTTCGYENTEYRFNSVNLTDSFSAKTKVQEIIVETFLEESLGLNKFIIKLESGEPINLYEFKVGGKIFSLSESNFDLDATVDGVLFATKSRENFNKYDGFVEFDSNYSGDAKKIVLAATGPGDCSYRVLTDFLETQSPCNLVELKPTQITIQADANSFDFDDEAELTVGLFDENGAGLANEVLAVGLGENSVEITTDSNGAATTSIQAAETNGVILAGFSGNDEYGSAQAVKRVPLQDFETFDNTQLVLGFFGAYYLVFLIVKKMAVGAI